LIDKNKAELIDKIVEKTILSKSDTTKSRLHPNQKSKPPNSQIPNSLIWIPKGPSEAVSKIEGN